MDRTHGKRHTLRKSRRRGAAVAAGFLVAGLVAGLTTTAAQAKITAPVLGSEIPVCVGGVGPDCPTTTTAASASDAGGASDPLGTVVGTVTGAVDNTVGAVSGGGSGSALDPVVKPVTGAVSGATGALGGGPRTTADDAGPTGTPLDAILGPVTDALGGAGDPISGLLAPITDALGGGAGGGNDAGPTGTPLDDLIALLQGGGGGDTPDPGAALGDLGTQLVLAITQIEDAICASPLGEVLRAVHEGLAPVLIPAKAALYDALNSLFRQLADALDNEDLALLPLAVQLIVDKLACPLSPPDDVIEATEPPNGEEPYAGGDGCPDYGGGDYGGGYGYGYGYGDGTACPTSDENPSGGPNGGGPTQSSSNGGGGPTLPFTGAGLALAFAGAGLITGGHLVRRLTRESGATS
jgi:hypothetical protein